MGVARLTLTFIAIFLIPCFNTITPFNGRGIDTNLFPYTYNSIRSMRLFVKKRQFRVFGKTRYDFQDFFKITSRAHILTENRHSGLIQSENRS